MNGLTSWKVALYLAGIFATGSVAGWMLGTKTAKEKMLTPPRHEEVARHMSQGLRQELKLSPEQDQKVRVLFERAAAELKTNFDNYMQKVRQTVSNRAEKIKALLTPEQQARFEEVERKRLERGRGHHHPPPSWRARRGTNNFTERAVAPPNCKPGGAASSPP